VAGRVVASFIIMAGTGKGEKERGEREDSEDVDASSNSAWKAPAP